MTNETATVAPTGNPGVEATEGIGAPPAQPKMSKADLKRQQIFQDRMRRHMSKGMSPQQAFMAIQKEDYERLPLADKMKRLEMTMMSGMQRLAQEITSLQSNDQVLADAMDANFRAITKALTKLGLSSEEQTTILKACEDEIQADRAAQAAARQAAAKAAQEAQQKQVVVAEVGKEGTPPPAPEGATTFGG